jgi:hypothetical protein
VDTKRDINAKINPIEAQLSISKVKNIKDGGVLVGLSSKEDNARFLIIIIIIIINIFPTGSTQLQEIMCCTTRLQANK